VWREFETKERFAAWWQLRRDDAHTTLVQFEPRLGGKFENQGTHGGYPIHFVGEIVTFDPPRELTFTWNAAPPRAWPASTYVTFRLTPALEGTLVEILHHGFERLAAMGAATHAGFEGGWSMDELRTLKRIVEEAK
jgi:uncharacterized protein YndB with AHSA1/START domain